MRITRIRVGSFGGIGDRDYRMGNGLTVLHGPNESGKTSTMELVRSVLVPSRKRKQYPERTKRDEGSVEFTDGGDFGRLELSGKDVEGTRPACVAGLDESIFRQVFAMGPDDLDEAEAITEGSIRSRFLTVPGGESMPEVMKRASEDVKKLAGLKSNSPSELLDADRELVTKREAVAALKERTEEFGGISERISALQSEIEKINAEAEAEEAPRRLHELYQSNAGNYERLASLKDERSALGTFVPVTAEDRAKAAELENARASAVSEEDTIQRQISRRKGDLDGANPSRLAVRGKEIDALPGRLDSRTDVPASAPAPVREAGGRRKTLLALGIVLVAVGAVAGALVNPILFAVSALGAAVAVMGFMSKGSLPAPAPAPRMDDSLERDVRDICSDVGVRYIGLEASIDALVEKRRIASAPPTEVDEMSARNRVLQADNALTAFYSRFSGEAGFAASISKTERAAALDAAISNLESSMRSAGLDPAVPVCPVEWKGSDASAKVSDASRELGELTARRDAILRMDDLERAMDSLSSAESSYDGALRDAAVAVLADSIAKDACTEAYGRVQPGVVRTAERYLSEMTGGLYSLDVDPATNDIVVRSGDVSKGMEAWSSGLRAQVLLSLKLAVAREMGNGEVPVMLDDVLLPFDSSRKAGAVRALASVAGEMQVIVFTCDDAVRDIASGTDGATVLDMV
ncbi:MAG: AAA family ATPase [Thermoplasmata archaeon]|nr:AAA family ATPase [Thermoplasmata archaeon]